MSAKTKFRLFCSLILLLFNDLTFTSAKVIAKGNYFPMSNDGAFADHFINTGNSELKKSTLEVPKSIPNSNVRTSYHNLTKDQTEYGTNVSKEKRTANLKDPLQNKVPITLNDYLAGKFGFWENIDDRSWISDTELQTILGRNVYILDVVTGRDTHHNFEKEISNYLGSSPLDKIIYSPDRQYLLITHSRKNFWMYCYTAKYAVYSIKDRAFQDLQPEPGEQPELQLVQWDNTGNSLAFVYRNDIYYKFRAMDTKVVRLTNDRSDIIWNGHTDFIYVDDIDGTCNALWFSQDSKHLAFLRFDDTNVGNYTFSKYGEPGDRNSVYPQQITIKYPKAGQTNPEWTLKVVSNLNRKVQTTKTIKFVNSDRNGRHYVSIVKWANLSDLLLITLNRAQTTATTFRCVRKTSRCTPILVESEPNGWVMGHTLGVLNGNNFLTLRYAPNGMQHIFMYFGENNTVGTISSGLIHVNDIIAWHEKNDKIYFSGTGVTSTNVHDPSQTQIYSVDMSYKTNDPPLCITCDAAFKNERNETCLDNSFRFSKDYHFVMHYCGGPNIPSTVIRKTLDWSEVWILESNDALRVIHESTQMPKNMDLKVPVATGYTANVRLILPEDFNEDNKYPLLIYVYAGPGTQQIGQRYEINWEKSLVSDKKIIYGLIDGRGSGKQTKDFMFQLNKALGTVEVEDQITATKYLIDNHPFVDANKTAIYGWSYGGYATAMAMAKDIGGVFKCGISCAPVTNWLHYDTCYTEKFMKLPTEEDNWKNYKAADVTTQVENFRNKKFFLVHGTADDIVHYQHSMMLARALEENDILFRQLSYPDESHGFSENMWKHLYHSLEDFLFTHCFSDKIMF